MFRRICNIASRACVITTQNRSPSQIAWGIAFGLSFGLIPKDNLLSAMLLACLLVFRVNHLAACIAFIATAPVQGWLAYIVHPTGQFILSQPSILSGLTSLYKVPGVAWLRLNNSLVMGGFATGMLTLVPVYTIARQIILKTQQRLSEIAVEQIANDATTYRKTVIEQTRQRTILVNAIPDEPIPKQSPSGVQPTAVSSQHSSVASSDGRSTTITVPSHQTVSLQSASEHQPVLTTESTSSTSTSVSLAVGSSITVELESAISSPPQNVLADTTALSDGITTSDAYDSVPKPLTVNDTISIQTKNIKPKIFTKVDEVITEGGETVLRETIIEVVRYKRPRIVSHPSEATQPDSQLTTQGEPMSIANAPQSETSFADAVTNPTIELHAMASTSSLDAMQTEALRSRTEFASSTTSTGAADSKPQLTIHPFRGEESLRYLLWHINGNRDSKKQSERTA